MFLLSGLLKGKEKVDFILRLLCEEGVGAKSPTTMGRPPQ